MEEMVPPSKKQLFLLNWWLKPEYKDKTAIIADGAIRTGKTVFMSLGFVAWSMEIFNDREFIMAGKTIASLRRNVIKPLLPRLKSLGYQVEEKKNENIIIISFGNTVNTYNLFGGKDEGSQDLVQGLTAAGVYFDEVALMPESFVNQSTARAFSVPGHKYWFNCNPAGPMHYFKAQWIDKLKKQQAIRMHFLMEDNPVLSIDAINEAKNRYSGVFYDRYILGKWSAGDDLVYDNFDEKSMVVDAPDERDIEDSLVAVDYGIVHPTVYALWVYANGVWTCLRSFYHDGSKTDMREDDEYLINQFRNFVGDLHPDVVIDPSAKNLINGIENSGYNTIPANNDVLNGIRLAQMRMNQGKVKFAHGVKGLEEFREYSWDKKKSDKGEEAVIKENDHFMDTFRYLVMEALPYESVNDENMFGMTLFKDY